MSGGYHPWSKFNAHRWSNLNARRQVFPGAVIQQNGGTDYRYRSVLPRELVAKAIHDAVMNVNWSNFKGAVKDRKRHDAYLRAWQAMFSLQEEQRRG